MGGRRAGPDRSARGPPHVRLVADRAAGIGFKQISTYMGRTSIQITLDRYGHLLPGSEAEAVQAIDAYLERADTSARLAALSA